MNKNPGIIVGIAVVLVIAGGIYAFSNNEDAMMEKEEFGSMSEKSSQLTEKEEIVESVGSYEAYDASKLARAETGDVVLFFHASWCPSCRALGSDIESNAGLIPAEVSILKVDYDKETDLKKKYSVTYQHTLVQVDRDGSLIKKWSGSPSLSSLLSQIQ